MVIVKNCYENFEGGKPVNACNSEYFPQEIQKKRIPYCMPHLFFNEEIRIIDQFL
jgi:hypothetical protein